MEAQTIQRHKYEYTFSPNDNNSAAAYVVKMVGASKRILELGTGPGSITKILKNFGNSITGIEIDSLAIEKAMPFCEKIYSTDLNDPLWVQEILPEPKFDVIVAADVLEHLYDPWTTLKNMSSLITPDGYVVVSLPHVGHATVIASLLDSNFEYQETGLLDKTHIRFFGIKNMQSLFEQANLKIVEADFVMFSPWEPYLIENYSSFSIDAQATAEKSSFSELYQVVIKALPLSSSLADNFPSINLSQSFELKKNDHQYSLPRKSFHSVLNEELNKTKQDIEKNYQEELSKTKQDIEKNYQELINIHNTLSWRVTRPLRWLKTLARKFYPL